MKYLSIISIVALALAGDSPISTDSKGKAPLVARFKKTSKSDIEGTIKFEPANNGTVLVSVDLTGLPSGVGPYPYHVHEKPVPESKTVLLQVCTLIRSMVPLLPKHQLL